MSTTAYLVAWRSKLHGGYRDAGIYDSPRPFSPVRDDEPFVVARAVSRYDGALGWSNASSELRSLVEKSPKLRWARNLSGLRRRQSYAAYRKTRAARAKKRVVRKRKRARGGR
jgi:hypothetical protein